jgi:hypothetical protein
MDSQKQIEDIYDQLMLLDGCVADNNQVKEYIELINLCELLDIVLENEDIYGDARDIIADVKQATLTNLPIRYGLVAASLTTYII